MHNFEIRFISSNPLKIQEAQAILAPAGVTVIPVRLKLDELQTEDPNLLVRDKLLRAFKRVGRPLFVEHTGLYLAYLNELPGGLTQIFWDKLQADRFSQLFGNTSDTTTIARTWIGYTDGRQMQFFHGEIKGCIAATPAGPPDFQWDCVFIPDNYGKTFAEMGDKKNDISMRRIALDQLANHLQSVGKA